MCTQRIFFSIIFFLRVVCLLFILFICVMYLVYELLNDNNKLRRKLQSTYNMQLQKHKLQHVMGIMTLFYIVLTARHRHLTTREAAWYIISVVSVCLYVYVCMSTCIMSVKR